MTWKSDWGNIILIVSSTLCSWRIVLSFISLLVLLVAIHPIDVFYVEILSFSE